MKCYLDEIMKLQMQAGNCLSCAHSYFRKKKRCENVQESSELNSIPAHFYTEFSYESMNVHKIEVLYAAFSHLPFAQSYFLTIVC